MRLAPIAILALIAVSAPAQAPGPLPPAPFNFTGNWDCMGNFANGKPHHSTFRGDIILKDKWLRLEETDIAPATGYVAQYLIGYDASAKKIVEFDANNFSAATYSSDDGWKDNTLTLTSAIDTSPKPPYVQNRFLFHIDAPDAFTMDWQVRRTVDAQWTPSDHLPCKRVADK